MHRHTNSLTGALPPIPRQIITPEISKNDILLKPRYCGEYFDKETGTYYLRARYYDANIGRFISEDSVWGKDNDPLSLNLYTYAHNNPILYNDPDGEAVNLVAAGVGAAIGTASNLVITAVRDYLDDGQFNTNWKVYAGSAASGAVGGATAGFTMGGSLIVQVAGHTAVGAATSAAASVTEQAIIQGYIEWDRVGHSALSGGISAGAVTGINRLYGYLKGTSKAARETLLESASNQKLKNAIDQIYRPGAKTGDGGLGDAIRHELKTGELVGGKSHIIKGTERVKNLENIIKTQNLNQSDLNIAQKLLNDLKNALGGK